MGGSGASRGWHICRSKGHSREAWDKPLLPPAFSFENGVLCSWDSGEH